MKAACRFFGKCSGCSLQQFPYVKQLHDKTRAVRTTLGRFVPEGKAVDSVILATVPSPSEMGYRSSSKLCLNEDELGRKSIGLYARGSKKVVAITDCPIHHPAINRLINRIFSPSQELPAPFYQHSRKAFQAGRLKFLTIRYSPETDCFGLVISHTGVPLADLAAWAGKLRLPQISIYCSQLKKEDEDLVISRDVTHLAGPQHFNYAIGGRSYLLDPMAFFQANSSLAAQFIDFITEDLAGNFLLDLYGGFGTYSLAAAARFEKIHLVEANPHSTLAAEQTAQSSGFKHITCSAIGVEDALKRPTKALKSQDATHVIVNPPRSGMSSRALQSIVEMPWTSLEKLHYVSCNIETLQRDLQVLLSKGGFILESVTPFDMFPQTEHIELVAKMSYRKKAARISTASAFKPVRIQPKTDRIKSPGKR